jgi:mannose-1-phosphate guanylyltransferase/mannose-6-phosphate isomerase
VWELSEKDALGNAAHGAAVFEDSRNVTTDSALVALEGVDDLVVVATADAVLVSRQKDANFLKRLVTKLKAVAPKVTEEHLKVHRPWGSYQSVDNSERHQVKRIVVKRGGRLSLQKHHHRAEHWIVVRGAARVAVNETVKTVHENESIYIPMGAVHRMENPGKIMLESSSRSRPAAISGKTTSSALKTTIKGRERRRAGAVSLAGFRGMRLGQRRNLP